MSGSMSKISYLKTNYSNNYSIIMQADEYKFVKLFLEIYAEEKTSLPCP